MRVSSKQLWLLGPEALASNGRWTGIVVRYSPLLVIAIAWELAAWLPVLPARVLPPLSAVLASWIRLVVSGELVANGLDSLYRLAVGLFLAVLVGTAAGLLMATSRSVNVFLGPLVRLFYPMPKSALIPVMVLWLGFGDASKIVLIFLGCLLPVAISAFNGARGVERTLIWSARSFGAGRLRARGRRDIAWCVAGHLERHSHCARHVLRLAGEL